MKLFVAFNWSVKCFIVEANYRVASVEAYVDNAFEEDKVALGKLEGFEFGPEQVPVLRVEVLKEKRVNGASENKNRQTINNG